MTIQKYRQHKTYLFQILVVAVVTLHVRLFVFRVVIVVRERDVVVRPGIVVSFLVVFPSNVRLFFFERERVLWFLVMDCVP